MDTPSTNPTFSFLAGGGEMGQLTRRYDWVSSPLGTPNHWPISLRAAVGIVLHSRFPMFLWWGADLIQFYNDPTGLVWASSANTPRP